MLSIAGQQQRRKYKPRFLGSHQHSITRHLTHLVLGTILPISGCAVSSLYFYKDMKAAAKLRVHLPPSHRFPYPLAMLSSLSLSLPPSLSLSDESFCFIPLPRPRHLTSTQHIKALQEWRLLHPDKASKHHGFEQKLRVHRLWRQRGEGERGHPQRLCTNKKRPKNGLSASKALQRTAGKALFLLILRSIKIHVSVLPL